MIRMSIGLSTAAAFAVAMLAGCGGEAPEPSATTATTAPAAAKPTPPTTTAGAQADTAEDDEPAPLLAWADSDTDEGKAPLTVQFQADVEGGTPPLKHVWKFGDGTPDSTEPNPKHVYEKPGKYRADLEVNDSAGDSDSDYLEIDVE